MESLGYVLIDLSGHLASEKLDASKKEEYDLIMEKKKNTTIKSLCNGLPDEFATYLNYTRSLEFEDEPDYNYLQKIFRDLYVNKGFKDDNDDKVFDWTVRKYEMNCQDTNQAV